MPAVRRLSPDASADRTLDRPADVASGREDPVSHNLNGQKLGRKGRDTRDRILAATVELLDGSDDEPISLSAVARKASLGMTSLYNYFTDLTELLLAVLEPVLATAEDAYLGMLRERWPDEEVGDRCHRFLWAFYNFWIQHSRLLHLRNAMADNRDERMLMHRVQSSQPVIILLAAQMDGSAEEPDSPAFAMATVLMTGLERTVTVATDTRFTEVFGPGNRYQAEHYLQPEARLMELAIRDTRERMAGR
ncbi:MAG: TetR/AcrR family transcriptional regulator [Novosphingobium sp.]|nr:TetR/AcrR family transcriptional regulator [Novosphingobium sp.]MCP5402857.1 TetR/AcrR family transcriptional regulator [Novosphingobium sp.]